MNAAFYMLKVISCETKIHNSCPDNQSIKLVMCKKNLLKS